MGDVNTGEIYELMEGQEPKPGDVPLTAEQASELRDLETEARKLRLQELRAQLTAKRPTIAELEQLINSGDAEDFIEITPAGQVVVLDEPRPREPRPLTMRENLGGEYAA